MGKDHNYEIPNSNLRRLMDSNDNIFHLIFKLDGESSGKNQIDIKTTLNKARICSKNINELYKIDPTITQYEIQVPKSFSKKAIEINEIIKLIIKSTEEEIKIPQEKLNIFTAILILLGENEPNTLKLEIENEEEALSLLNTNFHSSSIEYLSGHMTQFFQNRNFRNISEEIVKEIIDYYFELKDKNKIENNTNFDEEKLFEIMKQKEEDPNIVIYFLLNIDSDEYSQDMAEYVFNNINDETIINELPTVISFIRGNLSKMMQLNKSKSKIDGKVIECPFKGNELSGIISYLCKSTNNNNCVKLSCDGSSNSLVNLIKYDSSNINSVYINEYKESAKWIQFDFGERKINLTSYTIRTNSCGENLDAHPKTWKILGSNDGQEWSVIDNQAKNSILNGSYNQHRFECHKSNDYYKYIRYSQDESWYNRTDECRYKIKLSCIEFFGSINEK